MESTFVTRRWWDISHSCCQIWFPANTILRGMNIDTSKGICAEPNSSPQWYVFLSSLNQYQKIIFSPRLYYQFWGSTSYSPVWSTHSDRFREGSWNGATLLRWRWSQLRLSAIVGHTRGNRMRSDAETRAGEGHGDGRQREVRKGFLCLGQDQNP